MRREGALEQPLIWDSANYLGNAILIKRAITEHGVLGFANAWVHTSGTHTPLVPALAALIMFATGESRLAADLLLPIFTFILVWSIICIVRRLYPSERGPARAAPYLAAFLVATFPVALNQSRVFLFEYPLAAMVAATWAFLLTTDGFLKRRESLAAGCAAGLAALTRACSPVYLVGPFLIEAVDVLRAEPVGPRRKHFLQMLLVAAAISATWYLPNIRELYHYIFSVTYGDRGAQFAGDGALLSFENAAYLLKWTVIDGPGFPALGVAAIAYATACAHRRKVIFSPIIARLFFAFAISYLFVLLAFQRTGGLLLLPALGMIAIAMARACAAAPGALAWIFTIITFGMGAHHLVALTFTFPTDNATSAEYGPFADQFPLWNHRDAYLGITGEDHKETRWQSWILQLDDRLESLDLTNDAFVYLFMEGPYFQSHSLRLEALRRGKKWSVFSMQDLPAAPGGENLHSLRSNINYAEAFVVPSEDGEHYNATIEEIIAPLIDGPAARFQRAGEPMPFAKGASLVVYRRKSFVYDVAQIPAEATPINVAYYNPIPEAPRHRITLAAASYAADQDQRLLMLYFSYNGDNAPFPIITLFENRDAGAAYGLRQIEPEELHPPASAPASGSYRCYRIYLDDAPLPNPPPGDITLSLVLEQSSPTSRWRTSDSAEDQGSRQHILVIRKGATASQPR